MSQVPILSAHLPCLRKKWFSIQVQTANNNNKKKTCHTEKYENFPHAILCLGSFSNTNLEIRDVLQLTLLYTAGPTWMTFLMS